MCTLIHHCQCQVAPFKLLLAVTAAPLRQLLVFLSLLLQLLVAFHTFLL